MLCNICQKKIATVHLTEIVDEKIIELHVCQDCSQSKNSLAKEHFDVANFLGAFAGDHSEEKNQQIKCQRCGLIYSDFKKEGKLGCRNCYLSFKNLLLPLLKRIHGSTKHQGKRPGDFSPDLVSKQKAGREVSIDFQLKILGDKLRKAIELEEYEKAAKLRDQIKKLESSRP